MNFVLDYSVPYLTRLLFGIGNQRYDKLDSTIMLLE